MSSKFFSQPDLYSLEKHASRSTPRSGSSFLVWYHTLVLGIALAVIYSNLPIYGYVLNPGLLPKYAFFGIFFLMMPLVLIKYRAWPAYLASPFFACAALFLVLNLIHLAGFSQSSDIGGIYVEDSEMQAQRSLVATRVQYILFSMVLGFGAYTSTTKSYLYFVVFLMVLLPCAVIFDFAQPGVLYPIETDGAVLGRAAAMFINPTMAGEAVLLVFLLGCAVTRMKYRVPLFLLAGAGVIATFSRSSIIAWVLILAILILKKTLPRTAIVATAMVVGIALAFLGTFETYLHSREELDAAFGNILSRLNFFSSFSFDDDSSEERADVIRAGWELFLQNPVFGAGAGATQFWSERGSTHNQLLLLAAEYGIGGIGLWVSLLVILWKGTFFEDRGLQCAMTFLFVFMSLFTHQMFDSAFYWLATFALISIRGNKTNPPSSERARK
ncbi:O-antigen ligase family protein [Massilia niabensis]|uniref:O-antigen ligase family protein n=1 Tax=Massilia niabensis TaxID=544910 RepID=A0ABW0KY98_9BURK